MLVEKTGVHSVIYCIFSINAVVHYDSAQEHFMGQI